MVRRPHDRPPLAGRQGWVPDLDARPLRRAMGPGQVRAGRPLHPAVRQGRRPTQRAAFRRDELPNTTFFDRYFAGAVANPRIATIQGTQMWPAWIKKIRSSAERERQAEAKQKRLAAAAALSNRITGLYELLDAE